MIDCTCLLSVVLLVLNVVSTVNKLFALYVCLAHSLDAVCVGQCRPSYNFRCALPTDAQLGTATSNSNTSDLTFCRMPRLLVPTELCKTSSASTSSKLVRPRRRKPHASEDPYNWDKEGPRRRERARERAKQLAASNGVSPQVLAQVQLLECLTTQVPQSVLRHVIEPYVPREYFGFDHFLSRHDFSTACSRTWAFSFLDQWFPQLLFLVPNHLHAADTMVREVKSVEFRLVYNIPYSRSRLQTQTYTHIEVLFVYQPESTARCPFVASQFVQKPGGPRPRTVTTKGIQVTPTFVMALMAIVKQRRQADMGHCTFSYQFGPDPYQDRLSISQVLETQSRKDDTPVFHGLPWLYYPVQRVFRYKTTLERLDGDKSK